MLAWTRSSYYGGSGRPTVNPYSSKGPRLHPLACGTALPCVEVSMVAFLGGMGRSLPVKSAIK